MNDHDLMHNTIERLAQMDKWTKVLGGQLRNDGDWVIGQEPSRPVCETPLVWPELDLAEFPLHTAEGVKSQSKRSQAAIEKIALNTQNC